MAASSSGGVYYLEDRDLTIQVLLVAVAGCLLVLSLVLNLVCLIRCCLIQHYKEYNDRTPRMQSLLMMGPEIAWNRDFLQPKESHTSGVFQEPHRRSSGLGGNNGRISLKVFHDPAADVHNAYVDGQYSAMTLDPRVNRSRLQPHPVITPFNVMSHPSLVCLYDRRGQSMIGGPTMVSPYQWSTLSNSNSKNAMASPTTVAQSASSQYGQPFHGSLPFILFSNPSIPENIAASSGSLPPVQEHNVSPEHADNEMPTISDTASSTTSFRLRHGVSSARNAQQQHPLQINGYPPTVAGMSHEVNSRPWSWSPLHDTSGGAGEEVNEEEHSLMHHNQHLQ